MKETHSTSLRRMRMQVSFGPVNFQTMKMTTTTAMAHSAHALCAHTAMAALERAIM